VLIAANCSIESDWHDFEAIDEVTSLVIVDQLVNYLPLNLAELLPNLKKLAVINSSLIAIKKGFDQLEELNLSGNVIEELPSEVLCR